MSHVVIIGGGPYGLSVASHLSKKRVEFRIFGTPMQSWRRRMPKGMLLKSDGFASSLYDPDSSFTLRHYCEENNLPYADVGVPVPLETFAAYGLEFQRRMVPALEETDIISVTPIREGFALETADGQALHARKVVVAAGITHFGYLPPFLNGLPRESVSHSAEHSDLSGFHGRKVAVIGAGASAVDIAALLNQAGAQVELVARRREIAFHERPRQEPRPIFERIANPRSGLGLGWRSRLCTDAPLVFHMLPQKLRFHAVQRHLGPAPGWFVRDSVVGRFPLHLGTTIRRVHVRSGQVYLQFVEKDGSNAELVVDHLIAATGFRVAISKLKFLHEDLRQQVRKVDDTPVLSRSFESSVRGLYFVGVASANCFGPLTRFAYGAKFTARQISNHLAGAT